MNERVIIGRMKKSLSNETHTEILEIIGLSSKPISSTEVEARIRKPPYVKSGSQVYDRIRELAGFQYKDFCLFNWKEISEKSDAKYKRGLIARFNKGLGLGLDIGNKKDSININRQIHFESKDEFKNQFTISVGRDTLILIVRNQSSAVLSVFKSSKEKIRRLLIVKASNINTPVFIEDPDPQIFRFLHIELEKTVSNKISKLQENKKLVPDIEKVLNNGYDSSFNHEASEQGEKAIGEITKLQQNRKRYRYSLNLNGLLLYLLGTVSNKRKSWSSEKVIRNLSKSHLNRFFFLLYYEDFIMITGRNEEVVKFLSKIAIELEDQLYTLDKDAISYEVSKRYFRWLDGIFTFTEGRLFSFYGRFNLTADLRRKVRKYRLTMLRLLQLYEENQLSRTTAALNSYAFPSLSKHSKGKVISL